MKLSHGKFLVVFLISVVSLSCSNTDPDKYTQKAFNDRFIFLKYFQNISIIRSRGKNSIILYTYSGRYKNQFFFNKDGAGYYQLTTERREFDKDALNAKSVLFFFNKRLQIMNKYNVRDVSHEFWRQGVDMKIYFNSMQTLIYVSNMHTVKNEIWLDYLMRIKKLDDNWYFWYQQD